MRIVQNVLANPRKDLQSTGRFGVKIVPWRETKLSYPNLDTLYPFYLKWNFV